MTTRTHTHPASTQMSGSMKVADLIDLNYKLLGVLMRLGMKLGFGESTVTELCRRHNVDEHTFLQLCKAYTYKDYRPSAADLDKICAKDLLKYLKMSHQDYSRTALGVLDNFLKTILEKGDKRAEQVISKFFSDYKNELAKHFEYEEECIFPYVETLMDGNAHAAANTVLDEDHTDIGEKIDDLKNIVMKYLPESSTGSEILSTVTYLYMMRDDLIRHTAIEENILMPLIKRMEER